MTDWSKADRAKVLALAKDVRSSAATKTAVMHGRNISYVKGAKLVSYLVEKHKFTSDDAAAFGAALLREELTLKADVFDKDRKVLRPTGREPKAFDQNAFLVWTFEGSTGMRNLLLMAIVAAFFGLVLFPVWPQSAKVGVWYVSMTLLLVLLGFIFIRLFLFCFLYAFGVDFWILPNFFADDAGIWDSFKPVYSFHASKQNLKETYPYRLAVLVCLLAMAYWVWTQPTEFDEFVASQRAFVDELYEGTLLADKSQKEKEQIDKVIPDVETVQRELDELERLEAEQKEADKLDEMLQKSDSEVTDDDEVADL